MGMFFKEWKDSIDELKNSLDKSIEEVRQCKEAVLNAKPVFLDERSEGRFIRDDARLILSAPEILIGNLDSDGNLMGSSSAKIVLRGKDIALDGVSSDASGAGKIISRAAIIRQIAVDPGIDGMEDAVLEVSEITNQARSISINSCSDSDVFVPMPTQSSESGVFVNSDSRISIDASVSLENRKKGLENAVSTLEDTKKGLNSRVSSGKKIIDKLFKQIQDILDDADNVDKSDSGMSSNASYLDDLQMDIDTLSTSLIRLMNDYFHDLSLLAETCRKITALKQMKMSLPQAEEFKNNDTGASVYVRGENIVVVSEDGDGNIRTTDSSSVGINTKSFRVNADVEGELIDKSKILLRSQNVTLSTETLKYKDKTKKSSGGDILSSGDVNIISKNVTLSALDNEFTGDNLVKEKALTKDSRLSVRMENVDISSTDTEGKATGKVAVSAKDIEVKAMDVKKEDRSDDKLAQGGTLLLSAEKVFAGSKDASNKTKELQIAADKAGVFADTTAEIQQGQGGAVVQLDGGNLSVGGSKTQLYGETTVNGKASFKADIQAPKASIDNLEAKTSFKSTNISDGIAVPAPPSAATLTAKLKVQDKK